MVDQKNVLTKCLLLLEKCPWNGTWVKPFHSGNVHRDCFGEMNVCPMHAIMENNTSRYAATLRSGSCSKTMWDTELCPQTPKLFCIFGNDRGVQFCVHRILV